MDIFSWQVFVKIATLESIFMKGQGYPLDISALGVT